MTYSRMESDKITYCFRIEPMQMLMDYYDIKPMEEFQILNMTDSPYHFNKVGSLCNCENKIRNEMLSVLLKEPQSIGKVRKYYND